MNNKDDKPSPLQKNCPTCGAIFSCGATDTNDPCWCYQLPPFLPLENTTGCFCPVCLKETIIKKINKYIEALTPEDVINNKVKDLPKTGKEQEGIDFYIENGNYVFSTWYHLKRGFCCQNGCRHCPYGIL